MMNEDLKNSNPKSEIQNPKSHFDPITLEILWRRLVSIVDEADASVARTAFSSLLRDAHDYTCMFTDSRGQELVQGTFCTPGQAGAMALGVKKLVNSIPLDEYREGDVFIVNDPWLLAGHLNDVCVMSPIFYKERPVAFTACVFHHSDIGGRVASDNRQVYEEGIFIPPLKLYEAGVLNESVLNLIRWNVRTPEEVTGDLRSQVAANHVCAQKVAEMLADEGLTKKAKSKPVLMTGTVSETAPPTNTGPKSSKSMGISMSGWPVTLTRVGSSINGSISIEIV